VTRGISVQMQSTSAQTPGKSRGGRIPENLLLRCRADRSVDVYATSAHRTSGSARSEATNGIRERMNLHRSIG
jgi:hypothetical protein